MALPVYCRLRNPPLEPPDDWLDKNQSQMCDAFRAGGARDWVSQLVALWDLDEQSQAELADSLGLSTAQTSRFRNHFSASLAVIGQYAASRSVQITTPNHVRWSLRGLASSVQLAEWLASEGNVRRNRVPLPRQLSDDQICLLIVLEANALMGIWDNLTDRYERDLHEAAADDAFIKFLREIANTYLRLTQQYPPAKCRYSIYFPSGSATVASQWTLCSDINNLIRRIHWNGTHAWSAINSLTPWLGGLRDKEDD